MITNGDFQSKQDLLTTKLTIALFPYWSKLTEEIGFRAWVEATIMNEDFQSRQAGSPH